MDATSTGYRKRPAGSVTLRVLGALLTYPDASLRDSLGEMADLLAQERSLRPARAQEVQSLIAALQRTGALDAEAAYVELFDRGRATSLHLFEHVHGDSRERGPAMIDLAQTYERAGLYLAEGELPDYLPAVLEFASTQPAASARAFLGEISHLLKIVFGELLRRESAYASVLGALIEMAGEKAEAGPSIPEPPMDESWAEPVVFDGCSTQGQARPGQPQPIRIVPKSALTQGTAP
ncbi:MAG: nitrate reductase molybdenum cofactor assembly chaperone [Burkholderiaceae bacterium]|nr:nitrate reductase molybdenum cofactor assembly chaperone [Burkholderiaceae bacterium]